MLRGDDDINEDDAMGSACFGVARSGGKFNDMIKGAGQLHPFKVTASLAAFLACILFMLGVSLLQG